MLQVVEKTVPRRKRILIVEDNVDTAEYLAELLGAAGYQTTWAFNGEDAFAKLRSLPPENAGMELPFDLVLLDLMLTPGGIEGFEICRRIKSDDAFRHIAVIMVTGLGSTANKTRGLELGADDYVTKPFIPEELLARIRAALRVRDMEQAVLQRNRELAALNELFRLTSSSLDLDEVLATTLNQTLAVMGGKATLIALADAQDGSDVVLRMVHGIPLPAGDRLQTARWKPGQGLVGAVVDRGETIVSANLAADAQLFPLKAYGLNVAACTPLPSKRGVIGALMVLAQDDTLWSEHSHRLLEAIGRQVGGTIENARLYTQISRYAEELARSQAQLIQAEKLAAMGRLTIYIAHELNNPLQAVQNCLHLVLHRSLDEGKRQKYLEMAQEEVERLIKTVQRMLDFYRPSSSPQHAIDVHAIIEDVLALANKRLQRARVRTHKAFAPDVPPLKVNQDQLKQVFLNLVLNAAEAMPNGGELTITTRRSDDDRWAFVAFRDRGVGLSKEVMAHLFEPFYTTKSKGTGVGLAISYGLVEQHGGTIEVESTEGQGSCFTVKLPTGAVNGRQRR